MKYYIDITLLPNEDVSLGFLWQKIFQQVHIALVDNKVGENESAIALSVVEYKDKNFPLGRKLRLLADTEEVLVKLNIQEWLKRLRDYCQIEPIKNVPDDIKQYAQFKRKSVKSIENKAKRRAEHLNKPYAEVLAYLIKEGRSTKSELPFIKVESQNSKKRVEQGVSCQFLLFIECSLLEKPASGKFDCYGLSKTATVPWFD
ncbi:type I-F CRISPR-associated endoribonuclease Cas6/Csy4 [Candidatus Berkiella cookevillensis]|uniref:CRISPR-associated endonuclease Cas6/Csy4 n=1 Tax=Candidatus Berkiella cookevillensis TaxID=437022 RepID=A0A0Q9YK03_9GAMM|nr:type I-F CRISPR-associated endoribonuclease Cas6/Csy4 [Candidatus Berkiella cookevillensis]MCS5709102.1 type I-F CRISPR-associated endoribonuclease Cas6/Csy4 [Candidatus Berkiella cookevillensis]